MEFDKQEILEMFETYDKNVLVNNFNGGKDEINSLFELLSKIADQPEFERCAYILKRGVIMFSTRASSYGVLGFKKEYYLDQIENLE